jgi:phospholipid/cholesterol/gamma-HCH transport system substrate-binding protein
MRAFLATALAICCAGAVVQLVRTTDDAERTVVVAYFDNSNGVFVGDDVRILGVPVGRIEKIEPQPQRAKVTFWFASKYAVPADAAALIISPSLVSARAIELTPAYTGGPKLDDGTVIPQGRTAVPVEFDDLRAQLQRLTDTLQPTSPGGVSTLGALVNTAADNVRGQGRNIRDSLLALSDALSALGDHSDDLFGSVKNASTLVKALQATNDLTRQLNRNLAAVTATLADDPHEVGDAVEALNGVAGQVSTFIADNRDALGTAADKLASLTTAVTDSLDDVKEILHIAPTTYSNFINVYEPASGSATGIASLNNFDNPLQFICGAIQAASRLNNEQSAKLCAQYLAPIVKNRQYNFPPIAINPFVGTQARPNEITYSEDWLRPTTGPNAVPPAAVAPAPAVSIPASAGLPGMMLPAEAGAR